MLKEFREFAMRGNVMDLAVGVIIGAAFGKIVTSLVDDLIMPLVGLFTGGVDLIERVLGLAGAELRWGAFVQNIIDFLIVAFISLLDCARDEPIETRGTDDTHNKGMPLLLHDHSPQSRPLSELYV